jgi:nicotinate phosphoribosyltransferase
MSRFHIAGEEDIREGRTSDIYFFRTLEILEKEGKERTRVLGEFTAPSLPQDWEWAVFAGLEEAVRVLEGREVSLWAAPEGTIFRPRTARGVPVPIMTIEGPYAEFAIYETPVLGFICQASGIATKASRVRKVAGERRVISFGIRRMHPALAPMIERSVFIGGLDAITTPIGGELLGKEPVGTMPHALTVILGGPREAFTAMHKHLRKDVPRIALVDTYWDEKAETLAALEAIPELAGVRLDTPSSRRGNFANIVREVRWELDLRGHKNVKIYVSGALDERSIPGLVEAGAEGFGVGTSLSNAPSVDFAFDIVEVEGQPAAKRGKFGGRKEVFRCEADLTLEVNEETCPTCGAKMRPLFRKWLSKGKVAEDLPEVDAIREYTLEQLEKVSLAK